MGDLFDCIGLIGFIIGVFALAWFVNEITTPTQVYMENQVISDELTVEKRQGSWTYGLYECKPGIPYMNMSDKKIRSHCNV